MATENRTLYDRGRGHAERVGRLTPARDEKAAVAAVARAAGEGVKEARTAFDFFRDVEAVAESASGARGAILGGGHPHLTPSVIARLADLSPDGARAAMARADAGLHPLAPDPPPVYPMTRRSGTTTCPGSAPREIC